MRYVVLLEREGWETEVVGHWVDLESAVEYAKRQRRIGWNATVLPMRVLEESQR